MVILSPGRRMLLIYLKIKEVSQMKSLLNSSTPLSILLANITAFFLEVC